jgi:hypothetical protein
MNYIGMLLKPSSIQSRGRRITVKILHRILVYALVVSVLSLFVPIVAEQEYRCKLTGSRKYAIELCGLVNLSEREYQTLFERWRIEHNLFKGNIWFKGDSSNLTVLGRQQILFRGHTEIEWNKRYIDKLIADERDSELADLCQSLDSDDPVKLAEAWQRVKTSSEIAPNKG